MCYPADHDRDEQDRVNPQRQGCLAIHIRPRRSILAKVHETRFPPQRPGVQPRSEGSVIDLFRHHRNVRTDCEVCEERFVGVGIEAKQGAHIGIEKPADFIERAVDSRVDLPGLHSKETGRDVGEEHLEPELIRGI
jgi:hypothetical protein